MAQAHTLPALLAALHATSEPGTLDSIVSALGNRICSNGSYHVCSLLILQLTPHQRKQFAFSVRFQAADPRFMTWCH